MSGAQILRRTRIMELVGVIIAGIVIGLLGKFVALRNKDNILLWLTILSGIGGVLIGWFRLHAVRWQPGSPGMSTGPAGSPRSSSRRPSSSLHPHSPAATPPMVPDRSWFEVCDAVGPTGRELQPAQRHARVGAIARVFGVSRVRPTT